MFSESVFFSHALEIIHCSIIVQLLGLDLWEPSCDPKTEISEKLLKKLQDDITTWLDKAIEDIWEKDPQVKDKVIPETERLISK